MSVILQLSGLNTDEEIRKYWNLWILHVSRILQISLDFANSNLTFHKHIIFPSERLPYPASHLEILSSPVSCVGIQFIPQSRLLKLDQTVHQGKKSIRQTSTEVKYGMLSQIKSVRTWLMRRRSQKERRKSKKVKDPQLILQNF